MGSWDWLCHSLIVYVINGDSDDDGSDDDDDDCDDDECICNVLKPLTDGAVHAKQEHCTLRLYTIIQGCAWPLHPQKGWEIITCRGFY